jgi:1-deoxy-D-xylulose-5-phosphate synthase
MVELGRQNGKIVAITAAMPDGTGLNEFQNAFPGRFFDVGIAEGHAVTFAAGLALKGLRPVVAIYSSFLQRAYDQIIQDVALDNTDVIFCIDRAGLVGDDGPTHHGNFDVSYLNTVPNAVIMAPKDEKELRDMMFTATEYTGGPVFIRYPRGSGPGSPCDKPFEKLDIGVPEAVKIQKIGGNDDLGECSNDQRRDAAHPIVLISLGDMFEDASKVRELLAEKGIAADLINARFAKPLSADFYRMIFAKYPAIATFENNTVAGGFGTSVLSLAAQLGYRPKLLAFGLPDKFVPHGDVGLLKADLGLTPEKMAEKIQSEGLKL